MSSIESPLPHGALRQLRHLYLVAQPGEETEYVPRLYFEVKVDLSDVRSGFSETRSVNAAVEIYPLEPGDTVWTRDMALEVDPARVGTACPARVVLPRLPDYVGPDYLQRMETLFLSFLMRHFAVPVFRNFALKLYSRPGETLGDFRARCLELLSEPFRQDLDAMHQTFLRKLEQLRERYLVPSGVVAGAKDFNPARYDSSLYSQMHRVTELVADLFIQTELTLDRTLDDPPARAQGSTEIQARLSNTEVEARQEIRGLVEHYRDQVQTIDEYTVHPNLKDLHVVRSSILWLPREEVVA
jgi:hypothetical protein